MLSHRWTGTFDTPSPKIAKWREGKCGELVLAGNYPQVEFARSSWRETVLKLNSPARLGGNCGQIKFGSEYRRAFE
jgi:hypothetical protein